MADPKENAEHVMLVDLARNDLGRVAHAGSVHVDPYRAIERYSHVMHIVSGVQRRAGGRAATPSICSRRPSRPVRWWARPRCARCRSSTSSSRCGRGLYGGTVGYFGARGDMDHAITIRTLVFDGDEYSYQAGAGIVADSVPADRVRGSARQERRHGAGAGAREGGPVNAAPAAHRQLRFLHLQPGAGLPGAGCGGARATATTRISVAQPRRRSRRRTCDLARARHAGRCRRLHGHDRGLRRAHSGAGRVPRATSRSSRCSAARSCAPGGSCTARPRRSCTTAARSIRRPAAAVRGGPLPLADRRTRERCRRSSRSARAPPRVRSWAVRHRTPHRRRRAVSSREHSDARRPGAAGQFPEAFRRRNARRGQRQSADAA